MHMKINHLQPKDLRQELNGNSHLRRHLNVKHVIRSAVGGLYAAIFESEETIVAMGRITTDIALHFQNLAYAEVPLGIITEGKVVIFENGKATRHLTPGDFIGLFETSYFLHFKSKKRLGNWTLIADGDTKIIFFGKESFNQARAGSKKSFEHYLVELAKKDQVPKPLTELSLLDHFTHSVSLPLMDDILVIVHTHLLPSSYPLFRHLASVVNSQNLFMLDKPYSTVPRVADKVVEMGAELVRVTMKKGLAYEFSVQDSVRVLWDKVLLRLKKAAISKIIIIDDGADVIATVPWSDLPGIAVVGVEQTTRGIVRLKEGYGNFPSVINVAGSALKKEIESCFIAEAVTKEVRTLLHRIGKKKIGVVGTGNLGQRVIEQLANTKHTVTYYDFSKFNRMGSSREGAITSVSEIIEKNDVILGTTGKDFMKGVVLDKAKGKKYFASASSADVEFYTILNRAGFPSDRFESIILEPHPGLILEIVNAGYPINFNRKEEIESAIDMQLTRTLLYAGFVEALEVAKKEKTATIFKLDTQFQRDILNAWITIKSKTNKSFAALSTNQIEKLSEGEPLKMPGREENYHLHETTSPYLDIVRKHTKPYGIRVFGKEMLVYPNVMSPKYDWAGIFGVETLPDVRGKSVLELGCGSGIISLFAALRGALHVDAVDINPSAVKNTNANFKKHGLKNAKAFYSNLFSKVKGKYDLVIFNLPYHGNKPHDILERGVADEGYKMMKKFIASLPRYMNDDGTAFVGFSTSGDTALLLAQFKKSKLEVVEKYSDERYGYNCDAYILKKL